MTLSRDAVLKIVQTLNKKERKKPFNMGGTTRNACVVSACTHDPGHNYPHQEGGRGQRQGQGRGKERMRRLAKDMFAARGSIDNGNDGKISVIDMLEGNESARWSYPSRLVEEFVTRARTVYANPRAGPTEAAKVLEDCFSVLMTELPAWTKLFDAMKSLVSSLGPPRVSATSSTHDTTLRSTSHRQHLTVSGLADHQIKQPLRLSASPDHHPTELSSRCPTTTVNTVATAPAIKAPAAPSLASTATAAAPSNRAQRLRLKLNQSLEQLPCTKQFSKDCHLEIEQQRSEARRVAVPKLALPQGRTNSSLFSPSASHGTCSSEGQRKKPPVPHRPPCLEPRPEEDPEQLDGKPCAGLKSPNRTQEPAHCLDLEQELEPEPEPDSDSDRDSGPESGSEDTLKPTPSQPRQREAEPPQIQQPQQQQQKQKQKQKQKQTQTHKCQREEQEDAERKDKETRETGRVARNQIRRPKNVFHLRKGPFAGLKAQSKQECLPIEEERTEGVAEPPLQGESNGANKRPKVVIPKLDLSKVHQASCEHREEINPEIQQYLKSWIPEAHHLHNQHN